MYTYVYYVCFMYFLSSISQSCFHENELYFIYIYEDMFKVYVYVYVCNKQWWPHKRGAQCKKNRGPLFLVPNFFGPPQKRSSL